MFVTVGKIVGTPTARTTTNFTTGSIGLTHIPVRTYFGPKYVLILFPAVGFGGPGGVFFSFGISSGVPPSPPFLKPLPGPPKPPPGQLEMSRDNQKRVYCTPEILSKKQVIFDQGLDFLIFLSGN